MGKRRENLPRAMAIALHDLHFRSLGPAIHTVTSDDCRFRNCTTYCQAHSPIVGCSLVEEPIVGVRNSRTSKASHIPTALIEERRNAYQVAELADGLGGVGGWCCTVLQLDADRYFESLR